MQRIILTTGGTGGHIFPALSVAEVLQKESGIELHFVGSLYGPEKALAEKYGIPFHGFRVRGFLGRGLRAIPAVMRMGEAFFRSLFLLRSLRPMAVAGFGGYASFAPMLAARVLGVPHLLHEQNAVAGMSNRFLGKSATRICLSLPHTEGFPEEKCVLTGNPVRENVVLAGRRKTASGTTRHLLVLGGSQGAHALNTVMGTLLPFLRENGVEILHQTGVSDEESVRNEYQKAGYGGNSVRAFIDDMAEAYSWADLVLCRSGASTIAELSAMGLPSVLVPFPFAVHDHQTRNAEVLTTEGAALLVREEELAANPNDFGERLLSLLLSSERLHEMGERAKAMARPDAAELVAKEILSISGKAGGVYKKGVSTM
ncbi:MAG: undecaprenyldiphospho-muramoylpentapeptide beta-N-acetylglucosaminyltransferase [Desulfovibrio sp.]|nr:undecaprenyldiphospho-muramoylpentapeptide beta-N-acetylglucosaminyltransferase [Desulfovibrio sp.]